MKTVDLALKQATIGPLRPGAAPSFPHEGVYGRRIAKPRPMPAVITVESELDLGDRIAPVTARVNRRAKRLIVKVDAVAGRVLVTAPSKRALPAALRFAGTRKAWIREQLDEGLRATLFVAGGAFPYLGDTHRIVNDGPPRSPVRRTADQTFIVGGEPAHINRRVTDWLKREARVVLTGRADHYAERLGKNRGPLTIRDTRSRWGSCGADGAICFSWRLIFAPQWVVDYVAAHECAHLICLDHSPQYWRIVESLGVDRWAARDWFEKHGAQLHAYGVVTA